MDSELKHQAARSVTDVFQELNHQAAQCGRSARPSLLHRLYEKRREYENAIERINNTIRLVEGNQAVVEIVEAVLAGQQKADAPIF